jgi:hypothetical protein
MTPWIARPPEERALLNPSFCSCLLWQAATGYEAAAQAPLPFDVAFLVLPIVLHRETRESLPRAARTSLAVWIDSNPLVRSLVADRAQMLVPFTKEAMIFGGTHDLFDFAGIAVRPNPQWKKPIAADLRNSTDEVRDCAKRAEFLGKWLAGSGSSGTVMAMFGVRP